MSPHIYNLSKALVKNGVNVFIVTCDFPGASEHENVDGVEVFRVDSYRSVSPDFASWVYLMSANLQREASGLIKCLGGVDLIHAHDWLVATAGIGLKHMFRVPLVATIHSTEVGRRGGIYTNYQRMIHQTEWWFTYEAWKVICCSNYMKTCITRELGLPWEKVWVIPNGVNVDDFRLNFDKPSFRARYALPHEKLLLYVGRLVYEKGIHVLLNAMPKILSSVDVKLVIVGEGYMKDELLAQAHRLGIAHKVYFTGFVDDATVKLLYLCADACAFPSLYEPFGIVALEAMAAGAPVVASNRGGFSEIVDHDKTGVVVPSNNPDMLANAIIKVLSDQGYADWLRSNAFKKVSRDYNWHGIAQLTKRLYDEVLSEYEKGDWKPSSTLFK
jgi:glycosyltransferase involved in cell wall biosynthesis